jgi:uncharacterized protein YeaO (DUF488 family)
MALRVVRFGTPRVRDEGIRLGTVRRPPRGVRKGDFARRDYFDVWLPELAPSAELVSWALSQDWTPARWSRYAMLAAFSQHSNFSIGCYCDDESHCHRSLLRQLLVKAGAQIATEC